MVELKQKEAGALMVSLICYVDELQPLTLRLLVMCKHEINACFCFFYSQLDSRIHVPQCILTGTRLMAHLFLEFQERLPENMLTGCPVRTGHQVEYLEEKLGRSAGTYLASSH